MAQQRLQETTLLATSAPVPVGLPTAVIISNATERPTITIEPDAATATSALSSGGPWLVYWYDSHFTEGEAYDRLVLLNQDSSGRTLIKVPACDFYIPFLIKEDPSNRIAVWGRIYLIQPFQAIGKLIYSPWPTCHTAFTGNAEAGFLASIYRPARDAVPEMRIYELPGGRIHDQFPLVNCSDQDQGCDFSDVRSWEIQWSPNGRYLAFPAVLDGPSSDLYVYDIENGRLRRLTGGPNQVGQIWWSPDGRWIILGEILRDYPYPYTFSLWAVSVSGNEIRWLYSLTHPFPQGLVGWLDNDRLLVYNGTSLSLMCSTFLLKIFALLMYDPAR